jgi:hypothetical protein
MSLKFSKKDAVKLRFFISSCSKLRITKSDHVKRSVVYCVARTFLYESWHMAVTAMELNRIHRIDLVVAYILSMDAAVHRLLQMYEVDGLLTFRNNLKMPSKLPFLPYDPNIETMWSNEVVDFLVMCDLISDLSASTKKLFIYPSRRIVSTSFDCTPTSLYSGTGTIC